MKDWKKHTPAKRPKHSAQTLAIKHLQQMKIAIKLLLIIFCMNVKAFSQNDTIILKVNPIVGDTIDLNENNKYKLFNQFPIGQFEYAQYQIINDQVSVCITLIDKSEVRIPYSYELVLRDSKKINSTPNSSISTNTQKPGDNKVRLKLTNGKKTKRIRKGQKIRIYLNGELANQINPISSGKKEDPNLIKARFIGVNNENKPIIIIRSQKKGKPMRQIALEDIQMIRFYTEKEYTSWLYTSITFMPTGIILLILSYQIPAILPAALIVEYIGLKPYLRRNLKFDFSKNSEFIIY